MPVLSAFILCGCTTPEPTGGTVRISNSGSGAFEVAMTPYGDGAAVAWYDTRDGNAEIYLRLVDAAGQPVGDEHRLTVDAEDSYEASIAAIDDAVAVAWYGRRDDGSLTAYLGVFDPNGGWRWRDTVGDGVSSRNPVVRVRGETIFCAWIEQTEAGVTGDWVRAEFRNDGGELLSSTLTLGAAGQETWILNAALDSAGQGAYVVFDSPDSSDTYELFLAEIYDSAVRLKQLTASDGYTSKYPDIALARAETPLAALTWFDEKDGNQEAYLVVLSLDELGTATVDGNALRLSHTDGSTIGSYVSWSASGIGVAWSDQVDANYDVMFQAFDHDGMARAQIRAVTQSETESYVPAIIPWRDGFALAWNEVVPGSGAQHNTLGSEIFFARVAGGL